MVHLVKYASKVVCGAYEAFTAHPKRTPLKNRNIAYYALRSFQGWTRDKRLAPIQILTPLLTILLATMQITKLTLATAAPSIIQATKANLVLFFQELISSSIMNKIPYILVPKESS